MAIEKGGWGGAARLWYAAKVTFGLEARDSEAFKHRSDALREGTVFCDEFVALFLSYFAITGYLGCPLFVVVLPGSSAVVFCR